MADSQQWGWDLHRERAIPWSERGPAEDVLGPYPSREAAENWRDRVAERNEDWDDDPDWNDPDDAGATDGNPDETAD